MEPVLGLRVVRGPDWEWGDQDGGEGYVGTVVGLEEGGGEVIVQWDVGQRCRYRCGRDHKYDLRVLDNGPLSKSEESGIECGWCQEEGLVGVVWSCTRCLDYYLCSQCYNNDRHSIRHRFFKIPSATQPTNRERLSSRQESERVAIRGIFPGARVARGHDWRWGDQDGKMSGLVLEVKGWHQETKGGVVEVQWEGRGKKNIYRVGHKGKVDLMCLVAGEGGWYCSQHLPILGGGGGEKVEEGEFEVAAGDTVRIDLDLESVKIMQEDHGGWIEPMNSCIREVGQVINMFDNGDVQVRFPSNFVFNLNPLILIKVDIPFHVPGTPVRVLDDIEKVHELQKIGPGWNDDIALTLGVVGLLKKKTPTGEVQASVNGRRWHYHPKCLQPVPRHLYHTNPDVGDLDKLSRDKVLDILKRVDPRDGVWYLAATGDVSTLRDYLIRFPEEINRKMNGRTAIQLVCSEAYANCLRELLPYHPDLESQDENGLRPLQMCAYSNFSEGAQLLLDHGADANSKDSRQNTATMAAAALGHYGVLESLLSHRLLNIHAGDKIGSTALHCAVIAKRERAVKLLLEAGADPSIPNYTASTPLHDAAAFGYLPSVERMVAYYPQHLNLLKVDDGLIPLHAAAINDRLDVAHFLLSQPSCQIDRRTTDKGLAPLHIAVNEGHTAMVELLVGYGADLNALVENRITPLHMVLALKKMKPLSSDTPQLKQIQSTLVAGYEHEQRFEPYLLVACMLVQEGADPHIKNRLGENPLHTCSSDEATIIRLFARKQHVYHGSLRSKTSLLPTKLRRKSTVLEEGSSQEEVVAFPKHLKKDTKPATDAASATPTGVEAPPTESSSHSSSRQRESPAKANSERQRESGGDERGGKEEASGHIDRGGEEEATAYTEPLTLSLATLTVNDKEGDGLCCLCDKKIDSVLVPCGHSVMCGEHAGIAKRCPNCNEKIKGLTPL